ncbi:hypothetical protein CCACVL1_07816 [Corchorus capsularis]|uniref:RNase H type-1 domain-containing protein n=1 Tax=Corchorus capsularis TaxID=210143 RepID=A0A1R3J3Q0_COCAP|nr:hypothetical protein CCACVL1_07816 [Corchorus capsularis]
MIVEEFATKYGGVILLMDVQVDEGIIGDMLQFWDHLYRYFTLNKDDMVPTIEEMVVILKVTEHVEVSVMFSASIKIAQLLAPKPADIRFIIDTVNKASNKMKILMTVKDETSGLEIIAFEKHAEGMSGLKVATMASSKGISKEIIPEEVARTKKKKFILIVGLPSRAVDKDVHSFRIYAVTKVDESLPPPSTQLLLGNNSSNNDVSQSLNGEPTSSAEHRAPADLFLRETPEKQTSGKVRDYGDWIEEKWVWKIQLRRNLFGWEMQQWQYLLTLLEDATIFVEFKDKLIWKHNTSGHYSAKDFYRFSCSQNGVQDPLWSKVWMGIAPPKVEIFLRQFLRGRIAVRSVLKARGLISEEADQVIDIVNCRVAYWCKAKWPNHIASFDDLYRCSELIQNAPASTSRRPHMEWKTPNMGQMKFNVDGLAQGQPGDAGIGGILRDGSGNSKLIFSKPIGLPDSYMAELLAIKEAFLIFAATEWAKEKELIIKSDSKNVVKWVNDPNSGP